MDRRRRRRRRRTLTCFVEEVHELLDVLVVLQDGLLSLEPFLRAQSLLLLQPEQLPGLALSDQVVQPLPAAVQRYKDRDRDRDRETGTMSAEEIEREVDSISSHQRRCCVR